MARITCIFPVPYSNVYLLGCQKGHVGILDLDSLSVKMDSIYNYDVTSISGRIDHNSVIDYATTYDRTRVKLHSSRENKPRTRKGLTNDIIKTVSVSTYLSGEFIFGGSSGKIYYCDQNGQFIDRIQLENHPPVEELLFAHYAPRFVGRFAHNRIASWKIDPYPEVLAQLQRPDRITCMAISGNDSTLALGSGDGVISLYSLPELRLITSFRPGNSGIKFISVDWRSRIILSTDNNNVVSVYLRQSFRAIQPFHFEIKQNEDIVAALLNEEKDIFLLISTQGNIWFWNRYNMDYRGRLQLYRDGTWNYFNSRGAPADSSQRSPDGGRYLSATGGFKSIFDVP